MTTQNKGIDYGLGQANVNKQTGIRFGVIPQNALNPDAAEDIWQNGTDRDYEDYIEQVKANLRSSLSDYFSDHKWGDDKTSKLDDAVESAFDAISDGIGDAYQANGDCARMAYNSCGLHVQTDSSGDILVMESPFFTYAQFCSPCAPGACYLTNPLAEPDENNKAYCLGHDWFDDNKAPYPVYSVATGELINP